MQAKLKKKIQWILVIAAMLLSACGGGNGSGSQNSLADSQSSPSTQSSLSTVATAFDAPLDTTWQPPRGATPANGNYIYVESDPGDFPGWGMTLLYTSKNSVISISTIDFAHDALRVDLRGNYISLGSFHVPNTLAGIQPGTYVHQSADPAGASLLWGGCNFRDGWFVVDSVAFSNGEVSAIDLRFMQHCTDTGSDPYAYLHGKIHWSVADKTLPPGPLNPIPSYLWQPPAGVTPATGNYVYLESQPGDFIGLGKTYLYTPRNSYISGVATPQGVNRLMVSVQGYEDWTGQFQEMSTLTKIQPGYYGELKQFGAHNPAKGAISWTHPGLNCEASRFGLKGWFVIDNVTYLNGTMTSIDMRFFEACDGATTGLYGKIHWSSSDKTVPPGPSAIPSNLWQPPANALPASGNYVYMESALDDPIDHGNTYLFTRATSLLYVQANTENLYGSGHLYVGIGADNGAGWTANFYSMASISHLLPGYYPGLQTGNIWSEGSGPGNYNPAKGAVQWSGLYLGCDFENGWFAIDNISYINGVLDSIDLRFARSCDGATAAHGKIHWASGDTTVPPGPVNPPPQNLWQPTAGTTPSSGNFVYLQSDPGDTIGQGQTYLYTSANSTFSFPQATTSLTIWVAGNQQWTGIFQPMSSISQLMPGYYGEVGFYANSPIRGGLDWEAQGANNCRTIKGWYVVDNIAFSNGAISAIDLRFEQHCNGDTPALRGQIHWAG